MASAQVESQKASSLMEAAGTHLLQTTQKEGHPHAFFRARGTKGGSPFQSCLCLSRRKIMEVRNFRTSSFLRYLVSCGVGGCDAIEGNVCRDIVSRHDVLHAAHVLVDIVAIVLARVLQPLGVVFVELALVID